MNSVAERELRFERINRIFVPLYCLFSCALAVFYAIRGDGYHLGISLGTLAIPPGVALLYRILRLRRAHQMDFILLAFTTLAYTLGSCVEFYKLFPGFDKLVHMLSGVLASMLCLALYCALRPGHRFAPEELALALAFTFFGSMAVAGLWEIGEYLLSLITGRDLQNVAATGVADSMQDMIVCMLGTLMTLPAARRLSRGQSGPISGAVQAFVQKNYFANEAP